MGASKEIVFEATEAEEGGFDARSSGYGAFTQGDDWSHLKAMVKDAALRRLGADFAPRVVRLRFVKDQALAM